MGLERLSKRFQICYDDSSDLVHFNFPVIGSLGCHRLPEQKKKKKKNTNDFNRCLRTTRNVL